MITFQRLASFLLAAVLMAGCAGQHPYTYTGAAMGGGLGALTGAAVDGNNRWRGAAIGGLMGGVLGGVAGEVAQRSRPQQQGYYNNPSYGYSNNQPYDRNYGYNDGYSSAPSNNSYGRPYHPPGYRSYPPPVAQNPHYYSY